MVGKESKVMKKYRSIVVDDYQYFVGLLLSDGTLRMDRFQAYMGEEEIKELKKKGYIDEVVE